MCFQALTHSKGVRETPETPESAKTPIGSAFLQQFPVPHCSLMWSICILLTTPQQAQRSYNGPISHRYMLAITPGPLTAAASLN
jgi:hypothetical protein